MHCHKEYKIQKGKTAELLINKSEDRLSIKINQLTWVLQLHMRSCYDV